MAKPIIKYSATFSSTYETKQKSNLRSVASKFNGKYKSIESAKLFKKQKGPPKRKTLTCCTEDSKRKLINVSRGEYKRVAVAERDIKLGHKVSVQYRVSDLQGPNKTARSGLPGVNYLNLDALWLASGAG